MMIVGYLLHVGMRKVIAESCCTAVQQQCTAGVAATIHELAEILLPCFLSDAAAAHKYRMDESSSLAGWMVVVLRPLMMKMNEKLVGEA